LIGKIRRAHGVSGELEVGPLTDFPDRFRLLSTVFLGDGHVAYTIERVRARGRVFVSLEGIESREAAHALAGNEIWIPRSEAMPLPEGEYYTDELIGLEVVTTAGRAIGVITDLIETGANDVYIVDSNGSEVLIPAIKDVVVSIDISGGQVVIEPLLGLFD
jgi:16S rRNA processing protein RimM